MRPPKLTEKEINKIKIAVEKGGSVCKIAKQYGVDHTTIYFQLGRLKKRKPSLKSEKTKRIKQQYYYKKPVQEEKSGLSYAQILAKMSKIKIVRDKQTGEALKVINI